MDVLVLNMDYTPINITTLQRGFKLVFKGKAEILSSDDDKPILTEKKSYNRPKVIRLLKYIVMPFRKVNLNRQNLFKRDDFKCVYCRTDKDLTIDHVIPKVKGGDNKWTNLVTCCHDCNVKKGHKDLEVFLKETGLTMNHEPFKPTYLYFVEKIYKVDEDWKQYIGIIKD